jgi:ribosome-associated toxin RatA of RatAB toxin-antitoxin module
MPSWEHSTQINATPSEIWSVLADVEKWPEWTPTMTKVELLDEGPFGLGSRARVDLRPVGSSVWTVTKLEERRGFDWESSRPGLRITAGHWIECDADGSKVRLSVDMTGVQATLLYPFMAWVSRRNLHLEAEGLKGRSELST